MIEQSFRWRRWAAPRGEAVRALELAKNALGQWSGYPSACKTRVSYENDLTERTEDPDFLANLPKSDLAQIEDLWMDVEPDHAAYEAERDKVREAKYDAMAKSEPYDEREVPYPISARVAFRFSSGFTGLTIEVSGPERARVEGLVKGLRDILDQGRSAIPWYSPGFAGDALPLAFAFVFTVVGLFVGDQFAPHRKGFFWQDGVGLGFGFVSGFALGLLIRWMLPTLELVDDGERTRFRRVRGWFFGYVGLVIATIVAAFLYDAVKGA